jgi:hypothetical protein
LPVAALFKIAATRANSSSVNRRHSIVILVGLALLAAACGAIESLAENDVDKLEEGDCFDLDSLSDYDEYPEVREFNGILANRCRRFFDDWKPRSRLDGISVGWLVPTAESWDAGERRALCYSAQA